MAREHDLSRNLIRIWIAKCESGEFDPEDWAAFFLPYEYEPGRHYWATTVIPLTYLAERYLLADPRSRVGHRPRRRA